MKTESGAFFYISGKGHKNCDKLFPSTCQLLLLTFVKMFNPQVYKKNLGSRLLQNHVKDTLL